MNLTGRLNEAMQPVTAYWNARNARERMLLSVAMIVIALGLVYSLLIEPALAGRERLSKNLPVLRQQVAELQVLSKEASNLAAKGTVETAPISRDSIESGLVRKGMKPQNVAVTGDDVVRVQLAAVPFAGVVEWLDEMQRTAALSTIEANVVALPEAGQVNATLTLRQFKSE